MGTYCLKWSIATLMLAIIVYLNISCGGGNVIVTWNPEEVQIPSNNFKLKVFVENSGSMDGYMCAGAELKDAVYSYSSTLSSYADTTELHYINSKIIPYRDEIKSFISDLTPQKFRSAGGDRSNSDIAAMFEEILSKTDDNTVSIFVSDCILDVPNGAATKYFENRSIAIRNAFTKYLNRHTDLGVEIFRLESTFNGRYYYSSGSEVLNDTKRPYYMWVIGNKNILAYVNKEVPFSEIKHGVENYFAFSTSSIVPFEITNKYGMAKGNQCICTKNRQGEYEFLIKTNLQSRLHESYILCSSANYSTLNSKVRVNGITEISTSSQYTHIINMCIDSRNDIKGFAERIVLKPMYTPLWLEEANDDTGVEVKKNINKTTGIKYLIQGVADAYKKQQQLCEFDFVVSNR